MKNVIRYALVLTGLLFAGEAFAGSGTLAVTPGTGANIKTVTDGSSNNGPVTAIGDGSALANIAAVKAASTAPGATDPALVVGISPNTPALLVEPQAIASGGATLFTLNSAATTNATNVKASAGTLYHISVQNKAAAEEFLTFYNTSGTPTCGTSVVMTLQVPAVTSTGNAVGGIVEDFSVGAAFSSGIGICATTAIGGTGSVALNDLTINLAFK